MRWRPAILALLLAGLAGSPACADDLSNFHAAVEKAASHQRVAIAYLRTGNVDLAALEIERLRAAWSGVTAIKRPAALNRDPQLYTTTMLDVATKLVGATLVLDMGRPDVARDSLQAIRAQISALRKTNGIVVLADCIGDANAAMDRLMRFDESAINWSKSATAVANAAKAYGGDIERCDGMAGADIRSAPEFRRLIDGARNSLAQIPNAIAERDGNLLHRLLIELRSFDNLLAFRYG
jgi:hypothetical protein